MSFVACRKKQADSDRIKKRLEGIEHGRIITAKQSAPSTVLIDDIQEKRIDAYEVLIARTSILLLSWSNLITCRNNTFDAALDKLTTLVYFCRTHLIASLATFSSARAEHQKRH